MTDLGPRDPSTAGPPSGELNLSEEGQATVDSLAHWMRIVSVFFFLLTGLLGLMAAISLFGGVLGIIMVVVASTFAILMAMAGMWLRDAARQFRHGVAQDEELMLGQGFRSLRSFFIMYGIFNIIALASTIWDAVGD